MKKPSPATLLRNLCAFALMALCPSILPAQSTQPTPNPGNSSPAATEPASPLKRSDRHFISKVAEGNRKEMAFARLASLQAANPEVRRFAQQLMTDHASMEQDLTQLAQQKGVEMEPETVSSTNLPGAYVSPTATSAESSEVDSPGLGWSDDREYAHVSHSNGPDFDREFIAMMVEDHDYMIKLFEKNARNADDPEVKAFAAKYLPALQQHLSQAQSLQQSVK